jgi:two-component system response regulator YesN
VDDEELVIKSLKASVDWEEYGFEVAGFALDGAEALDKIREMKPEIVFTDVRMPGISGLELIKNCKELNLNTIFIVVSGYAEFAYAQKAMNFGALGYCLKPFDDMEIISFLKRARSMIEKAKASECIQLMELIEEGDEKSCRAIEKILKDSGIPLHSGSKMGILVSIGRNPLKFRDFARILVLKTGRDKYTYFVPETEMPHAEKLVNQKIEGIKGKGICKGIMNAREIRVAISQAEIMAYGYFTSDKNNLPEDQPGETKESTAPLRKLEEKINREDVPGTIKLIDELPELFEQGQLNIRHAIILYNQVMGFAGRLRNIQFEEYIYSFEKLVSAFRDIREMLSYLRQSLAEELNIKYELGPSKRMSQTFKAILRYVNENYCRDISAQSIAKDFNVNSNYFSQLFKKELGTAFTEYLVKLRMDHACRLLKNTDDPISEIAEQVGYNDYFYFSRVFKKVVGKSPSSYRMDS